MGLGFKEVIDVTKKGYTPGDIVELNNIIKEGKHKQDDILSLALNGMKIDDLKNTLQIIEEGASGPSDQGKPDERDSGDNSGKDPETPEDSSNEESDNIDYKKLYETEKALREKLQQQNTRKDVSGDAGNGLSDFEAALKFAEDVLN